MRGNWRAVTSLKLALAVACTAAAMIAAIGPAPARALPEGECALRSLPSFNAQGFGKLALSAADIVEVECGGEAGKQVSIEDRELDARCDKHLTCYATSPLGKIVGTGIKVTLDEAGQATAVASGYGCIPGETLLAASLDSAPYSTVESTFTVLAPSQGTPGVFAHPERPVEGGDGTVADIVEAVFEPVFAQERTELVLSNLSNRCKRHLLWIFQGREKTGGKSIEVQLDNNGRAFAIVIGGPGCSRGESLIVAELVLAPYTQLTTALTIEA
jgi:hypothetical protein